MTSESAETTGTAYTAGEGRVSWRRLLAGFAVTGSAAAVLVVLTAQGVLAANFSVSGMPFTVTADKLEGTGFEQFATLDNMAPDSPNAGDTGGQLVLIVSAVKTASLTNLCQSINLGGTNLKLTAGDNGTPVTATNLVVDSDLVSGDAAFNDIDIGQDASTLTRVPGVTGNIGVFGQQARTVTITHLRQNNYATTAATFKLAHLKMSFESDGC
ncbi:MAG: cholesterol esterase [Catenulispora sp.]|nr:cholesterol esterase [Catenulispora sp.]